MPPHSRQLFLMGGNHRTAPLDVREKMALEESQIEILYDHLGKQSDLTECIVLNTCNRFELYGVSTQPISNENAAGMLFKVRCSAPELFLKNGYWREGREVVRHIFLVSAGMDSQLLGETEILGQVKHAYSSAIAHSTAGPLLHRVFQKSFQAAKWVRTHTTIGRGQVSVGNVASELARRIFGDLGKSRILLVGTGEVGAKTAKSLRSRGAGFLCVTSRTWTNARELGAEVEAEAIPYEGWRGQLSTFDIIICSTAAPDTILAGEEVEKSMAKRPNRPFFMIDLAVPRDIDMKAADIPNVFLYNLDDLAEIAGENLRGRRRDIDRCRRTLDLRSQRLWASLGERLPR